MTTNPAIPITAAKIGKIISIIILANIFSNIWV
jgi:hypothetical protein